MSKEVFIREAENGGSVVEFSDSMFETIKELADKAGVSPEEWVKNLIDKAADGE